MKKKICMILLCFITLFSPITVAAQTAPATETMQVSNPDVQPCAENTEYRYKQINGKWHKRLWSNTYNRWIDPEWIPV